MTDNRTSSNPPKGEHEASRERDAARDLKDVGAAAAAAVGQAGANVGAAVSQAGRDAGRDLGATANELAGRAARLVADVQAEGADIRKVATREFEAAKDIARREFEDARHQARNVAGEVRSEAQRLADEVKARGVEEVERGKSVAASTLTDFAQAVRTAADELGGRDQSMAANLVREAANGLESLSRSISGADLGDITRSVSGFARRQPTAFLIGAALAGVALGRFVRASSERSRRYPRDNDGYDGYGRNGGYGDDGYGRNDGYGSGDGRAVRFTGENADWRFESDGRGESRLRADARGERMQGARTWDDAERSAARYEGSGGIGQDRPRGTGGETVGTNYVGATAGSPDRDLPKGNASAGTATTGASSEHAGQKDAGSAATGSTGAQAGQGVDNKPKPASQPAPIAGSGTKVTSGAKSQADLHIGGAAKDAASDRDKPGIARPDTSSAGKAGDK